MQIIKNIAKYGLKGDILNIIFRIKFVLRFIFYVKIIKKMGREGRDGHLCFTCSLQGFQSSEGNGLILQNIHYFGGK